MQLSSPKTRQRLTVKSEYRFNHGNISPSYLGCGFTGFSLMSFSFVDVSVQYFNETILKNDVPVSKEPVYYLDTLKSIKHLIYESTWLDHMILTDMSTGKVYDSPESIRRLLGAP